MKKYVEVTWVEEEYKFVFCTEYFFGVVFWVENDMTFL